MIDSSPPCVIPVAKNRFIQILPDNVYESFAGPNVDPIAFMRAIAIEGLEAREYNLASGEDSSHGSCTIEVNTRSITSLNVVVGMIDETPPGTDPAPQCELGRRVAAAIARTYVPLAGGTPWSPTPQQPTAQPTGEHSACDVVGRTAAFGFIEGTEGQPGTDGTATTCAYIQGDARADAWYSMELPAQWQTALPPLADNELTTDSQLGVMPARLQLTPDGSTCSEAVQYTRGQALRISYQNPTFKPEALCRIAEQIVGNVIARITDRAA